MENQTIPSFGSRNLIIASTSTIYGGKYLDYLRDEMNDFFKNIQTITFIPYARPGGISHDDYTQMAQEAFEKMGKKLIGLHTYGNALEGLKRAEAIFTGGGNTFVLVKALYHFELMQPLREAILNGLPYMGSSAGSNICGVSMHTTNDMPIVYPPSFKTLGVIPFNLNPHYLDPDTGSKHMGETRETRIKEFHSQNTVPVIGLREGSWLRVKNEEILLKGELNARVFEQGKDAYEVKTGTDFSKFK